MTTDLPNVAADARSVRARRRRRIEARTWVATWRVGAGMRSAADGLGIMGASARTAAGQMADFGVELELDYLWRNA